MLTNWPVISSRIVNKFVDPFPCLYSACVLNCVSLTGGFPQNEIKYGMHKQQNYTHKKGSPLLDRQQIILCKHYSSIAQVILADSFCHDTGIMTHTNSSCTIGQCENIFAKLGRTGSNWIVPDPTADHVVRLQDLQSQGCGFESPILPLISQWLE